MLTILTKAIASNHDVGQPWTKSRKCTELPSQPLPHPLSLLFHEIRAAASLHLSVGMTDFWGGGIELTKAFDLWLLVDVSLK